MAPDSPIEKVSARLLPDRIVIVCGMPRGGTTYLYHALPSHPEVFVPFRKELHYFFFNKQRGDQWFHEFFRHMHPGQVGFDISPGYFFDSRCIEHIQHYNPNAKVILSVRDPVEWSLSLYRVLDSVQFNMPPFAEFIEHYDHKLGQTSFPLRLAGGHMTHIIRECQSAFGDSLLIYDMKLLREDLPSVMRAIERFAGLRPYFTEQTIDRSTIHAGARRNLKPLTWLLRREWLISILGATVPHELLRKTRDRYDVLMSAGNRKPASSLYSEEDCQLATKIFAKERETVERLFASNRIQLGSGKPFA